jgi:hypothetical protein
MGALVVFNWNTVPEAVKRQILEMLWLNGSIQHVRGYSETDPKDAGCALGVVREELCSSGPVAVVLEVGRGSAI